MSELILKCYQWWKMYLEAEPEAQTISPSSQTISPSSYDHISNHILQNSLRGSLKTT